MLDRKKLTQYIVTGVLVLLVVSTLAWMIFYLVFFEKKIGICMNDLHNVAAQRYCDALTEALTAQGYRVTVVDAKGDAAEQSRQVQAFVEEKYDALVLSPVDTAALPVLARQAQNIPVILTGCPMPKSGMEQWLSMYYVGTDPSQAGVVQAEMVLSLPDKGDINGDGAVSYLLLCGPADQEETAVRSNGLRTRLENSTAAARMLEILSTEGDQQLAQVKTAASLARLGKDIEVIVCNTDTIALGALEAIIDGGRTVGEDVYLLGIGGDMQALEKIKSGSISGTVAEDVTALSEKVAEVLGILFDNMQAEWSYYVNHASITRDTLVSNIGQ